MNDRLRKALRIEMLESRTMLAAPHIVGDTMHVQGTPRDDMFSYFVDSNRAIRVNGASHSVPTDVQRVVFHGGGGNDSMTARISGGAELSPGQARLFAGTREVLVDGVHKIVVYGAAGQAVRFADSGAVDTFTDRENYARMFGPDYDNVAHGFSSVAAMSDGNPNDVAWFYNLTGAHVYSGRETSSRSFNASHQATAFGFANVYARGSDAEGDLAELHGGAGDDEFTASPDESRLSGANFYYMVMDFDKVVGRGGTGGNDRAYLYDSLGDDTLSAWPIFTRLEGVGYSVEAKGFDVVHSRADAGGRDTAWLYDGADYDRFESMPGASSIQGNGVWNIASGFELVVSRSTHGGGDNAIFFDSTGNDDFSWKDGIARLVGDGYDNRAIGYARVDLHADQGGEDRAWLQPVSDDDRYSGAGVGGQLAEANRLLTHSGVEHVTVVWPGAHHPVPDAHSLAYSLTIADQSAGTLLAAGNGIVHPWRVLPHIYNPGRVLVITGEGEQGGPSFLHLVDARTLAPISPPLNVGASASDFAWLGGYLVVTARNSAEIFLVDVEGWRLVDRASVFQEAIAVAAMSRNRFAIASIREKELQVFRVDGGRLSLERKVAMPGTAYDVTFDSVLNRLYVNHPSRQAISEVDVESWSIVRQHLVGGEPSYGGAIMGRYYIATDRDGFVHFIDRTSGSHHRLDLCAALELDPAQVAVRGIEPTDLILLSSNRLVVINNRQDSLVLEFNSEEPFETPRVLARFAGAAFGAALSSTELLVTTPALNRIDRLKLSQVEDQVKTMLTMNLVGVNPVAAVRIGDGGAATLAVLMSDHRLLLISELTGVSKSFDTINGHFVSARHPLTADEHGRLWLVVNGLAGRRLVGLSANGTVLYDFASDLASPFAIDAAHGQVVVIDRTNQRIQHVDVALRMSETMTLPDQRPRNAQILGPTEWLIIHDTNPHIGITHYRNGERSYQSYTGGRWLSGLALDAFGRAVVLDFNGSVAEYDVNNRVFRPLASLPIDGTMELMYHDGRLWVVSPSDSSVAILKQGAMSDVTLWSNTRAFDVVPSNGGAWLVTDSGLRWRANYADAAWWL